MTSASLLAMMFLASFLADKHQFLKCKAAGLGLQPSRAAGLGKIADAKDVALPFGDRNHSARIEQIEDVARLDALIVGGQHLEMALDVRARFRLAGRKQRLALLLGVTEALKQHGGIGKLEIVPGIFFLGLLENIAV